MSAQYVCGVYLNIVGSTWFLSICVGVKLLPVGVWRTLVLCQRLWPIERNSDIDTIWCVISSM